MNGWIALIILALIFAGATLTQVLLARSSPASRSGTSASSVATFLWDGGGNARPPAAVAAMLFVPASAFVLAALRGDFATAQTVEQDRAEIRYLLEVLSLSKADAQRLLSMPRQAWEKNVAHAVIAGTAQRTGGKPPSPASPIMLGLYTPTHDGFVLRPKLSEPIGMLIKTPEGVVITTLEYLKGDVRPSRIWGACRGPRALTTSVNEVRFYLDSWPALARAPQSDVQKKSIAELQSQMAPEVDVSGHFERTLLVISCSFLRSLRRRAMNRGRPLPFMPLPLARSRSTTVAG